MSHFAALVQAIVYQQLAGPAARAIHGRLLAALDDDPAPEPLLALSDETLRTVGLSAAKVRSLRDLAAKVLDGAVMLAPRALGRQSDAEIVERLSTVRGIGPWSAEMFLLFQLRRLDVWPGRRSRPCARATAWPGASRGRPRASSSRSATPSATTARSLPGTAGAPPSSAPEPREAR